MPNSFLPPVEQGGRHSKEGVILLGDAWNMRHPLTGGGMTVALNDVVILSQLLCEVQNFGRWDQISDVLHRWHWARKPLSSTINILSVALYDLFGADGESVLATTFWPLTLSQMKN
jgi:squalene monooxygenase